MYLLFDIGGTKMRVSSSEDGKSLGEVLQGKTPQSWQDAVPLLSKMFEEVSYGKKVKAVAGGLPGVFNKKHEFLERAPHLPMWVTARIKETIAGITKSDVYLLNDTVMAGLGEANFGAGSGHNLVAYLTVSTGLGGVKIERGKFDETLTGSEPGHQIIEATKLLSLENMVSGSAFSKMYGDNFIKTAPAECWSNAAKFLAIGLHNTILHWSPDIVVLGGSMMLVPPSIPIDLVRSHLKGIMKIFPAVPPVELAKLGDSSGLYGALAYLNARM
jgi:predicted NBD/HSP70 family sugar kinase